MLKLVVIIVWYLTRRLFTKEEYIHAQNKFKICNGCKIVEAHSESHINLCTTDESTNLGGQDP